MRSATIPVRERPAARPAVAAGGPSDRGVRDIVAFFLLADALSWAWVIPWAATGHTVAQGRGWPTHLPSLLGPMVAAVLVTAWGGGGAGVADLVRRMARWRIGWRWWLAAASPLAWFAATLATMAAAGAAMPPRGDFSRFSGVPAALGPVGLALVVILVNGIGEEAGWRGFALPALQRPLGVLASTLVIAVLWAGWHIPQFFLLDSYRDFAAPMLPVFVFGLTCGAVVWTWMYNRTGSILAVAVWHGLYNVTGGTMAAGDGSGILAASMWTFMVGVATVLLLVEWRARRLGRPSVLAPA